MVNVNSTIFRTIKDEVTGANKSIGLFGKSFTELKGILSSVKTNGLFKTSIISDTDIQCIKNYNTLIEDGTPHLEAMEQATIGASAATKKMIENANGNTIALNKMTIGAKAASVGIKLLSTAMNIGVTLAITTLISGVTKMIGAFDEMSQQVSEATSKYKEQAASIDEYKNKITELKTALNDENISYSDARDKRSQLLDIQKQLIDTYGAEASGIDLVNGSLDDQINKLETLNKQKRQEWENEVNKLSTGQQWQKWSGYLGLALLDTVTLDWSFYDANKWLEDFDNTTNIERIQEKFENFKSSINLSDLDLDSDELEKLKSQLDSFNGVSFKWNKMNIAGDAKTVQDTITQIQTQVIGSREDLRSLDQDLKNVYNSAKKITDENWDTYNTALQNQILDDKTGLEYYGKLTEAAEAYQEAKKDGDENATNKAKEDYTKLLSDISNSDMDVTWKKFFENMYTDMSDIVDDWKFEINIVPKINTNKDGLKDDIETVKGLTTEEISAAFENNGTGVSKDQWKAITGLNAEAQANGLNLTVFLEQLREAGYLVSQLDKDIEKVVNDTKNKYGDGVDWGKYFKDNSIDTQEEIYKWNEVTKGAKTAAEAVEMYNAAKKKDDETDISSKQSMIKSLTDLSEGFEALDKIYADIKDKGTFDFSNLADSKFTETFGKLGDDYTNFIEIVSSSPNDINACQGAFDKLIKSWITSKDIVNSLTEENKDLAASMLTNYGVANASEIVNTILANKQKELGSQVGFTKQEVDNLTSAYGQLDVKLDETTGFYYIQENALKQLNKSSYELKVAMLENAKAEAEAVAKSTESIIKNLEKQIIASNIIKSHMSSSSFNDFHPNESPDLKLQQEYERKKAILAKQQAYIAKSEAKLQSLANSVSSNIDVDWSPSYNGGTDSNKGNSGSSSSSSSSDKSSSSSDKNEALDNYLKYAERLYKTHQDETKYINDLEWALNNLTKTEEERLEILDDIEQARKDYADNRIKDIEHEIEMAQKLDENADVRDYYRQIQQIAHEEAERLRSIGYDNNSNEVQEMQKIWWDAENSIVDVTESIGESIVEMADRAGDAFEATVKRIEKNIDAVDHKLELLYATDRTPNIEAEGNLYTEKITNQQDLVDSYRHNQEMAHVNANDTRRQFSDVVD